MFVFVFTGAAKCQNEDYMIGIWQCCSRFLASKYKSRPLRNDDFKFWFSTYWNPAQHVSISHIISIIIRKKLHLNEMVLLLKLFLKIVSKLCCWVRTPKSQLTISCISQAVNADDQSDTELCVKEADPPPNSEQSSLVSSTEGRTRSVWFSRSITGIIYNI